MFDTINELWKTYGEAAERIVVDVPIGLCESHDTTDGCVQTDSELSRLCDDLARNSSRPSIIVSVHRAMPRRRNGRSGG
jgi:hypothetical protein